MKRAKYHLLWTLVLTAYSTILVKVMVFKEVPMVRFGHLMLNFGGTEAGGPANFVPFKTIVPYLFGYKGWIIAGINLAGNVGLLVPVGLLLPLVYKDLTWRKSLLLAALAGFLIEGLQAVFRVGIFDIDDVILNGLGIMVGYGVYKIFIERLRPWRSRLNGKTDKA